MFRRHLSYWAARIGLCLIIVWVIYKTATGWKPLARGSTSYSINVLNKIPIEDASFINVRSWLKELPSLQNIVQPDPQFWMKYLRLADKPMVEEVLNIKVEGLGGEEIVEKYHEIISKPAQGVCQNLKRFGGNWWSDNNSLDGHRSVCLDHSHIWDAKGNCLVYSFGIADDWSFEDDLSFLGCKVFAHDPTVDYPATRGENIRFYKLGLSQYTGFQQKFGFPVDTLYRIILNNNHNKTIINYLKVDIEGSELSSMSEWLSSGALDHVQQIGMEIHISGVPQSSLWCSWIGPALVSILGYQEAEVLCWYKEMLLTLQKFYKEGFRLVSSSQSRIPGVGILLSGFGISGNPYPLRMFNVVLMRDNIWDCLENVGERRCPIKQ